MTFLRKEMLRTTITTTKPSRIVFVSVAVAAVVFGGYITALAVLAPEQLAEATAAATDVVCSGCVGTTDIADSAVTTAKIGSGQVANSDIANDAVGSAKIAAGQVANSDIAGNAVTSTKIAAGQVANSDIATSAVTGSKISDTSGVASVDIVNGQVTSADIGDGQVATADIAPGAVEIIINPTHIQGEQVTIPAGGSADATVDCPAGQFVTGGGFFAEENIRIINSFAADGNTWSVNGKNDADGSQNLVAFAICIDSSLSGPRPPPV